MLARDKGNFHAPGENRTRDPASFCQQVDDWMLLKISEKIIQRNVFYLKKKKPGLSADCGLPTTVPSRTSIVPVKQKLIFLHARSTLASVSSKNKHLR